jgi:putative ABC transport system permease protein
MIADTKYALRNLGRTPGFTAVAVLTLALGIGATTAIFSAVDALLLRSLPYPQAERLVMLWVDGTERGFARQDVTNPPTMYDWERELRGVERLAGYTGWRPTLTGQGDPQQLAGGIVTQGYFDTVGVQPALGRGFLPEEDVPEGPQRVVISHGLWQRMFGGATDVLGKSLDLNARQYEVIGVMPAGFAAPNLPEAELWAARQAEREGGRGGFFMEVIARLKPGVAIEQVDAELDTVMQGLGERFPQDLHQLSGYVQPLGEYVVEGVRTQLLVLLGATAFVLLIACANLTNLMLARASGRGREFAVRAALGAGRARIVRQMFTESCVLAVGGALAGLAVAWLGVRWISTAMPDGLTAAAPLGLDVRVLGFAVLAALVSALLFGSAPALGAARHDLVLALRDGDRASSGGKAGQRVRALLVVLNFALAVALTVGAGLFLKSLSRLQAVDPGFRPTGVLTYTLTLPFVR